MNTPTRSQLTLLAWLVRAQWREHPASLATAALSIAIGVALALGIHLVNRSALAQFASALAVVNGDAQAQILPRAGFLDEAIFVSLARQAGIAAASPIVELRIQAQSAQVTGAPVTVRMLGIDPIRAAAVTPGLMPSLAQTLKGDPAQLFADDAVFLSRAAVRALGVSEDQRITLTAGDLSKTMRVAGGLEGIGDGQLLMVTDIANAQEYFGLLGKLSRIDLRFESDADATALRNQIASQLPGSAVWSEPQAAGQRMSNLSRAYRVNLNVLAMVALFTGAFIVQATLSLRVLRQQRELALIGVIGAPRRLGAWRVLIDALMVGLPGSLIGVIGGVALAVLLLRLTGGDLGGGYFSADTLALSADALSLVIAFLVGLVVALAGALAPLRIARTIPPALALKASSIEPALATGKSVGLASLGLVVAAALIAAPAIAGLPLASYAAIALMLVAGVALAGPIITPSAHAAARFVEHHRFPVPFWLATQRVAGAPSSTAAMLGGVIASFALASAMAIMVTSFRISVSEWLDQVLPADVYARLTPSGAAAGFGEPLQARLSQLPGAKQTEFTRIVPLLLDPSQPPVALVARPLDITAADTRLPLTGRSAVIPPGSLPVWITEAVVDLYGWRPGEIRSLPIVTHSGTTAVFVAGVWRDYSRQHGAIAMDIGVYRQLTGDLTANEVAWWLNTNTDAAALIEQARQTSPVAQDMEFRETAELKALSLRIFDRSFAITHALEAIAIAVALFGVASAVAGEALARLKEFGMLRHLGLTRAQISSQFAIESIIGAVFAILWGLGLGAAVAWILVHRVNPQSFHWTMNLHWPWTVLFGTGITMVLLSAITARIAAREATSDSPVRAVREDW